MLCSLTFCHRDKEQAKRCLRLIRDLCGQQPYTLILACEPGVEDEEIKTLAREAFKQANLMPLQPARDEWPDAPNSYFYQIAKAMSENTKEEWLFLEPDVTVLKRDAFYLIRQDYQNCGKPFYGPISPTYRPNPEGGLKQTGNHLMGVAIYPWDYFLRSKILKYLPENNRAMREAGLMPEAFDCFLEGETTPNAFEAKLIQHAWKSKNFRVENDNIHFDVMHDIGQQKIIRNEAVMFHGCKDDTLDKIVRERELGQPQQKEVRYEPAVEQIIPEITTGALTQSSSGYPDDSGEWRQKFLLGEIAAILTTLSRRSLNVTTRMKLAMEARQILTDLGIPCLESAEVKAIEKDIKRKKYARQPKLAFDPRASKQTDTPDWIAEPKIAARYQELLTMAQSKPGYIALRSLSFTAAKKHNLKGALAMKTPERIRLILADEFSKEIPGAEPIKAAA